MRTPSHGKSAIESNAGEAAANGAGLSQPQRLDQARALRLRQPRSVEIVALRALFGLGAVFLV